MPFDQALQPRGRIELGPFGAKGCDGVALLADVGMQSQHAFGTNRGFELDAVHIGGRKYQEADHDEVEDPHGQPPLRTSSRTGHAGNGAAACAGVSVRSAARNFAERARGLAAISSSSGVTGRLVRTRKLGGSSASWC